MIFISAAVNFGFIKATVFSIKNDAK